MYITTSGNVGIGTTTPGGYSLNVNGSQFVNGAVVANSSFYHPRKVIYSWSATGTKYAKIFSTGQFAPAYLNFDLSCGANHEAISNVEIFIPKYNHWVGYTTTKPIIKTMASELVGYPSVFSDVLIVKPSEGVTEVWLKLTGANIGTTAYITNRAGAEDIFASGLVQDAAPTTLVDSYPIPSNGSMTYSHGMNIAGSIGIGTTVPTQKLDVNGNVKAISLIGNGASLTNNAAGSMMTLNPNIKVAYTDANPNGSIDMYGWGSGEASNSLAARIKWGNINNCNLGGARFGIDIVNTNYVYQNALTIAGTGNIGLGTVTPVARLHINNGDLRFTNSLQTSSDFSQNQGVLFGDELDRLSAKISAVRTAWVNAPTDLVFYTSVGATGVVSEKMRITSGGSVVVAGLAGGGNQQIYVNNSGAFYLGGASDRNLKKNIATISSEIDPLASLQKLRGVFFNWDNSKPRAADLGTQREMGLIAQEVETVLPQVVGTNNDGTKSVDYPKLTAYLIEVAKQQQVQIEQLKTESTAQKAINEKLSGRLNALENK
jgi:hypothetical protein